RELFRRVVPHPDRLSIQGHAHRIGGKADARAIPVATRCVQRDLPGTDSSDDRRDHETAWPQTGGDVDRSRRQIRNAVEWTKIRECRVKDLARQSFELMDAEMPDGNPIAESGGSDSRPRLFDHVWRPVDRGHAVTLPCERFIVQPWTASEIKNAAASHDPTA